MEERDDTSTQTSPPTQVVSVTLMKRRLFPLFSQFLHVTTTLPLEPPMVRLGTGGRISGVGGLDSAGLDDNERLGGGVVVVGNARPSFGGDSDLERCRTTAAAAAGDGDTDIDRRGGDGGATVVAAAAGDFERDLERDFAASGLEDLTEAAEEAELRRFRRRRRAAAALADFTLEAADFSLSLSEDDDDDEDDDEDDEDEDDDDDLELSSTPSPSLSDELLSSSELVELFSSSELSTAELSSSEFFFPPSLSLSSL